MISFQPSSEKSATTGREMGSQPSFWEVVTVPSSPERSARRCQPNTRMWSCEGGKEGMRQTDRQTETDRQADRHDNPRINKVVNKVWGNQTQPSLVSV